MAAKVGDPCCFCGEPLAMVGIDAACQSRDENGSVCVGRIRPQEELPADIERLRVIGRAILKNLEDRRGIAHVFNDLKRESPFVYSRLEWELGQAANDV